jgi:hypothetical protein
MAIGCFVVAMNALIRYETLDTVTFYCVKNISEKPNNRLIKIRESKVYQLVEAPQNNI